MKINVRSPYKITTTLSGLIYSIMDIYIYTGTKVATLPSTTYTLRSTAIDEVAEFEISELVRDYIDNNFDGYYPTDNTVWVNYQIANVTASITQLGSIQTLRAFYGYDYYWETANQDQELLQSNDKILVLADNGFQIGIDTETTSEVTYVDDEGNEFTTSISTSNESDEQITYIGNITAGEDSFEQRVLNDGGTFESSLCLIDFLNDYEVFGVSKIYITGDNGTQVLNVEEVEECKYTPYKLTFVNKFGAYQDVWFFKASKKSLTTEKDDYKSNDANINKHQYKILNKSGKEKLTINSGYYPEQYNEVFKQMLLSEEVWIDFENKTLPINISNSSFNYKTHLNDKLINYTLDIDFAFDTINTVR